MIDEVSDQIIEFIGCKKRRYTAGIRVRPAWEWKVYYGHR